MKNKITFFTLSAMLFALSVSAAEAQQPKAYRVGVITTGGA